MPAASLHTSSSSQAEASQQLTEHQDAESLDDGSVLALVRLAHQMATEQEAWQKEVLDSETVYEQQQRRALEVASKRQELVRKALVQLSELHMVAKRAAKEQELRSLKWTVSDLQYDSIRCYVKQKLIKACMCMCCVLSGAQAWREAPAAYRCL